MKRVIFFLSFCISFIIFNSCTTSSGPDYAKIIDPVERWHAYKISSYSFDQHRSCFCPNRAWIVRITVRDNQITDIKKVSDGTSVSHDLWSQYKTVNELFDLIKSINKDSVAAFRAEYDSVYGYPTNFYVDPSAAIADEEYGYDSKNLSLF